MQEHDEFHYYPYDDDMPYEDIPYEQYEAEVQEMLDLLEDGTKCYWCPLCNSGSPMIETTLWVRYSDGHETIIWDEKELQAGDREVEYLVCSDCEYTLLPEDYEREWRERND